MTTVDDAIKMGSCNTSEVELEGPGSNIELEVNRYKIQPGLLLPKQAFSRLTRALFLEARRKIKKF